MQDEVQHGCTSGDWKEQRKERRRVRGAVTTDEEVMGLLRRLVGALERGVEVLEAMESRYQNGRAGEGV